MSGAFFQPGTADLLEKEVQKLDAMKTILNQRPQLILELTPLINSKVDAKAINQNKLFAQLNWSQLPDFSQNKDLESLKQLFLNSNSADNWSELEIRNTTDQGLNSQQLAYDAWHYILENQPEPTDLEFDSLAKNRVLSIQKQLIEQFEIPDSRVFIKPQIIDDSFPPQIQFGINN